MSSADESPPLASFIKQRVCEVCDRETHGVADVELAYGGETGALPMCTECRAIWCAGGGGG